MDDSSSSYDDYEDGEKVTNLYADRYLNEIEEDEETSDGSSYDPDETVSESEDYTSEDYTSEEDTSEEDS